MRFFRYSRSYRIWASILWSLVFCVWVPVAFLHRLRHPWQPWIWLFLTLTQFASLWTYWNITGNELVAHSLGCRRRYKLSAIDGIGSPAKHRRLLAKTVQIDYRGRHSLYLTVDEKQAFQDALRTAVATHEHEPPTTGPLGLSV